MNRNTPGEIVDEASKWLAGGGIVTLALAPLALPGIALLLVAALPLLVLALAAGLLAGAVIGPIVLVRAIARLVSAADRPKRVRREVLPVAVSTPRAC